MLVIMAPFLIMSGSTSPTISVFLFTSAVPTLAIPLAKQDLNLKPKLLREDKYLSVIAFAVSSVITGSFSSTFL